jgi:hypothetical protein
VRLPPCFPRPRSRRYGATRPARCSHASCVAQSSKPLDSARARLTGILCGRTGSSDVVDAAVVVSAAQRGDLILTADPDDLRPLAAAVGNVEVRSLSA